MELQGKFYFDTSALSNTHYLVQIALEQIMGNNLFRGNLSRIIYASQGYSFRQRINLLSQNGVESINALSLPYMSYFRRGNWDLDSRPGALNAYAAIIGVEDPGLNDQHLRYMLSKVTFDCLAFYSTDVDAQLAYEVLQWMKYPTDKQFKFDSITYKNVDISIPITLNVDNITFNEGKSEKDWLNANRIIPIGFTITMRSVVLGQAPQGPESTEFYNEPTPVITRKVLLDFLSYKGNSDLFSQNNTDLIVLSNFTPDPNLNGTFTTGTITNNSIVVHWDYNPAADTLYQPNVLLALGNNDQFSVPRNQKTYTFSGLQGSSLYNMYIFFFKNDGTVTKYIISATTTVQNTIGLAPMKGLKAVGM